ERNEERRITWALDLIRLTATLDACVVASLGLSPDDLQSIDSGYGLHPDSYGLALADSDTPRVNAMWLLDDEAIVESVVRMRGPRRQLTKKSYFGDRRLELLAHAFQVNPTVIARVVRE